MNNKILYKDISPGARADATLLPPLLQPFSNPQDILKENVTIQPLASFEKNRWVLDGSLEVIPNVPQAKQWGLVSKAMSDSGGVFSTPIALEIAFTQKHTSVGLSFVFDKMWGAYPSNITVKWYRDNVLLSEVDFLPNEVEYSCIHQVELYNKVVIIFNKTAFPKNYIYINSIMFGICRTFGSSELKAVNILNEVTPYELSVNTIGFDLNVQTGIPFLFQKKQPLELYHKDRLMGMFFIDNSTQYDDTQYTVEGIDWVGILEESDFLGGMYTGQTAYSVAQKIMGDTPFTISDALKNVVIHGYLEKMTGRDALHQLCVAIGGVATTSGGSINIISPNNVVSCNITDEQIFVGTQVSTAANVTGVEVIAHQYTVGAENVELFKGTLNGRRTVTFSQPAHSLNITGGAIIESGVNYAIINGNGAVSLVGKQYAHTREVCRVDTPNMGAGDLVNVKKIEDITLVGIHNAATVAARLWDYENKRDTVNATIIVENQQAGDMVTISTPFSGSVTGVIEQMDITAGGGLTAAVIVRGGRNI